MPWLLGVTLFQLIFSAACVKDVVSCRFDPEFVIRVTVGDDVDTRRSVAHAAAGELTRTSERWLPGTVPDAASTDLSAFQVRAFEETLGTVVNLDTTDVWVVCGYADLKPLDSLRLAVLTACLDEATRVLARMGQGTEGH